MRRLVSLFSFALVIGVIPAMSTPAVADPAQAPGWTVAGDTLVWTAPSVMPLSDAGVEFWDGDRLLGRPASSPDMRTFTLKVPGPHKALQVRSAGRRLDVELPAAASLTQPVLPPQLPAAATDPGTPGPYATTRGEYVLEPIKLPGYEAAIEMEAVVVAPDKAPGKRPLALFLHGRHFTCYNKANPDQITAQWPCPAGMTAVPSHRGYLKAQQLLASQGYVTVSISANGVNAQDAWSPDAGAQARSSLVRTHLAKWADWAGAKRTEAPQVVRDAPVADLANVLLVGHSRGGEGVNRAATDSLTPPPGDTGFSGPVRWTIRAGVLIGPTIFGQNPAPDVPSVTILPGCDGDVSDLQGQLYVDQTRGVSRDTALHSALYVVGANHNYFNSEWTPGQAEAPASDDFRSPPADAVCSPGTATRLTADQQQAMGATYIAATARLFLARDASVLPLLDGTGVRAPSADPARVLAHAVGADRKAFVVPDEKLRAEGSARICNQITRNAAAACTTETRSPHFVGWRGPEEQPDRLAVALTWSAPGQRATVRLPSPVSLAGSRELALRLSVPPNSAAAKFAVGVVDSRGNRTTLGSVSVTGLPGTERTSALWAQEVRVPLPRVGDVVALELVPESGAGQAWLIDAHGWDRGLPAVPPTRLSRVDVGALTTVKEGDSGTVTHRIPITATGGGNRAVRLYVSDGTAEPFTTRLVTLKPGETRLDVPVEVVGNTRWSHGKRYLVYAQAVRGTVIGGTTGRLQVEDDDPMPTATAVPITDRVAEGGKLAWRVTLSAAADSAVFFSGAALPGAAELSTTDVPADWFRAHARDEEPLPSRPLSSTRFRLYAEFPAGQQSMDVEVPTAVDGETEPEEQLRMRMSGIDPGAATFELAGTVTDAARQ